MAGDASFASVATLLHLDTGILDVATSPKVYTAFGGAAISATAKFGAGSLSLTGGNSYITTPYHADFDFGTGDASIECRIRCNSFSAAQTVFAKCSGTNGVVREIALQVLNSTTIRFYHGVRGTSSTTRDFTVPTMSINTWYALEWCRESGDMMVFLEGTESTTGAITDATDLDGTLPIYIGSFYAGSVSSPFDGFIDEFRVTNGEARNNADYTPDTVAFVGGLGQVIGTVRDVAGNPLLRTVRCYRRDTGALVGETTSDVSTGLYTIDCATLDEVSRIVLDDSSGLLFNDLIDRVIPA